MADRDPFVFDRLAEYRIETLLADGARRRAAAPIRGWRRAAGLTIVRLGELLLGDDRGEPTRPLRPAGAAR